MIGLYALRAPKYAIASAGHPWSVKLNSIRLGMSFLQFYIHK